MLQRTTAAQTKMGTSRHDPRGRGLQHLEHLRFVMLSMPRGALETHPLALERTGNEHRFAVADDAIAVVVESHHDALLHQLGQGAARSAAHADPGAAAAGHAARNSA